MTAPDRHYLPNCEIAPAYEQRYRLYGEINGAMGPLWDRIASERAPN